MEGLSSLLQSFSNAFTPVVDFFIWLWPVKVYRVKDGERGIILTLGKVRRRRAEVGPGVHLCYCMEECEVFQTQGEFVDLHAQTIRSKDHKVVVVNAAVEYSVNDVKKAFLLTNDLPPLVTVTCENEFRDWARTHTLNEMLDSGTLVGTLTRRVNKKLEKHGVTVEDIMVADMRPHDVTLATDTLRDLMTVYLKLRVDDEAKG